MCDKYASEHDNVIVCHKENEGQAIARNVGIDMATGDYIGFIDADDDCDADMYEVLYNIIAENNADMSACGHSSFYADRVDKIISARKVICDMRSIRLKFTVSLDGFPKRSLRME